MIDLLIIRVLICAIPRIQYNIQNIMSGKRERPAHFQIDQKTLEYKDVSDLADQRQKDSPDKILQRKFYKIKGPVETKNEVSQTKANFKLFGQPTQVSQDKFKDNQSNNQEQKQENKQDTVKQETKIQPPKDVKNIFGTSNLFGSNRFSNGIGIFTNNGNGSSLFGGNSNIFAKKDPVPQTTQAKSEVKKPISSVFGTSQSIFSFSTNGVPPIKKQIAGQKPQGEEDEGDSAQLENIQKKQIDPSKSTGTYQYSSNCQALFQKKILKFKKGEGDLVQNTEVFVQQDSEKKTTWIIIRLIATKNPILTGLIVQGKSSIKKMGSKEQNVALTVMQIKDKKHEPVAIKLQFQKPEQGRTFTEIIGNLIK